MLIFQPTYCIPTFFQILYQQHCPESITIGLETPSFPLKQYQTMGKQWHIGNFSSGYFLQQTLKIAPKPCKLRVGRVSCTFTELQGCRCRRIPNKLNHRSPHDPMCICFPCTHRNPVEVELFHKVIQVIQWLGCCLNNQQWRNQKAAGQGETVRYWLRTAWNTT